MENYDITAVLIWLYASGGSSTVLSVVFERWQKFQSLTSEEKEYTFTYASIVLSLIAYVVVTYVPVEILNSIAPIFNIVVGTVVTVLLGKLVNKTDNIPSSKG